jgi:hypothetical protein
MSDEPRASRFRGLGWRALGALVGGIGVLVLGQLYSLIGGA